ncbi:hypothetical protein [Cryptosporangium minutisporangium]|uniref:DUF1648 domain-containing protein n=1 Tax=Cryptosporangium minutisporangium TaxID=113569 RepID=A0ABP6SPI5_9ACTN
MRIRRVVAAASLLVPPLAIGVSWLAWHDRLPMRVASHWPDLTSAPDGTMATDAALAGTGAAALGAAVAGAVTAAVTTQSDATRRGAFAVVGFIGGMAAGLWLVPTALTLRAGSPDDAVLGGWVVALVASGAYGAVPYLLSPPGSAPVSPVSADRVDLRPGETGAWSRTITAPLFAWAGAGLLAIGVVHSAIMWATGQRSGALSLTPLILLGLVVALFVRLRVTVDWRGLRVVPAALRIPLKRIPLDRVAEVGAVDVNPAEWGGWGYRWMPGRSAIVLRHGPGLVVTTTNGKRFAVTLDDPHEPAALLETLRAGRGPSPTPSVR